ncbi:cytochrome P450 [Rhodococcoides yunnanense]|uniref:cytochrome P450 n=1 Tax=Rhodococcoides yunnanense TaxID=278209 RepID=UPI0009334923|nr:cytochrome P450 [Rhodococcus yunnanensis]
MSQDQALKYPLDYQGALDAPEEWERLRQQCPVARVELPSGDEAVLLTKHEHVKQLMSDPRFTRPGVEDHSARLTAGDTAGTIATGGSLMSISGEGEGHSLWRRRVGKWFTAKRMTALRPSMTEMAERLVDQMIEGGQPADLAASLGFPLPVFVICEMLGVPAEDRHRFSRWSDAMLSISRYSAEESEAAQTEFFEYMSSHVDSKRAEPADDLLSMLIADSEADDEGLTNEQLVSTGVGLLLAGHETTARMISKMVAILLADRSHWEQLLADPALVRTAVEEALRLDVNLGFGLRRYVSEDIELGSTVVPKGTTVICSQSSANRDGDIFENADGMNLGRSPNPHLVFGAGPHSCLGQALARTELQVVLTVLLDKLPTLRLAIETSDLERVEGLLVGGLRELPVAW